MTRENKQSNNKKTTYEMYSCEQNKVAKTIKKQQTKPKEKIIHRNKSQMKKTKTTTFRWYSNARVSWEWPVLQKNYLHFETKKKTEKKTAKRPTDDFHSDAKLARKNFLYYNRYKVVIKLNFKI